MFSYCHVMCCSPCCVVCCVLFVAWCMLFVCAFNRVLNPDVCCFGNGCVWSVVSSCCLVDVVCCMCRCVLLVVVIYAWCVVCFHGL